MYRNGETAMNRLDQMKSRELLVEERMSLRQCDFTAMSKHLFFFGTWNVNGQSPRSHEPLEPWLTNFEGQPHIYIVGFQELDLDKRAYVYEASIREVEWLKAVESSISRKGKYKMVRSIRLVGMMLAVYVLEEDVEYVTHIAATAVGTGIMGWMGNKGAVGVRLEFHGSHLCFVCAHFAAHTEEVERRNEDYRNICEKMVFTHLEYPKRIKEHDMIFWVGDFNYRIAISRHEAHKILQGDLPSLLKDLADHDQLQLQMAHQKVFLGYREGKIKFRPTYKYDVGTDTWDSSEKARVPSWCDRILWKCKDGEKVEQLMYTSVKDLRLSDHKPVMALFDVGIRVVDKPKKKKVYETVLKEIDKEENLFIPQASVDRQDFKLGEITFIQQVEHRLTVANTGQVPIIFEFILALGKESYCKDWLKITPNKSHISQGEVCYVELQVCVDKKSAAKLTMGTDKLEDILILHLEGGKDFFVSLQGEYVPSCFGMNLETLAARTSPVRPHLFVKTEQLISFDTPDLTSSSKAPLSPPAHIPVEVWMLLCHLYASSTDIPDLFLQPGLPEEVEKIRDHLDARLPLPLPGSGHSVAEALLLLFDALPEPLVPYKLYNECLEASASWPNAKFVLEKFPKTHRETFKAFMVLLRKLQPRWEQHSSTDLGTLEILADLVLKPSVEVNKNMAIMGAIGKGAMKQAISRKKTAFLHMFLVNRLEDEPIIPSDLWQTGAAMSDNRPAALPQSKSIVTFPVTFTD